MVFTQSRAKGPKIALEWCYRFVLWLLAIGNTQKLLLMDGSLIHRPGGMYEMYSPRIVQSDWTV